MHVLLGLLAIVAVVLAAPSDDVYPITIGEDYEAVAWTVALQEREATCRAKAWIGRMGDQPLATVFAVELDEMVAPTAEGETPLYGLHPGTYDLHYEGAGCQWAFSLIPGKPLRTPA
jgi:hypothetical protein